MARTQVERITCDLCGKELDSPKSQAIGLGRDQWWELDLCGTDLDKIVAQVGKWTAKARPVKVAARRNRRAAKDDWEYLESRGFTRHRGRKSTEELEALKLRGATK